MNAIVPIQSPSAGDGLPDEQVAVTLAADEGPDAHGVWES